MTETTATAPPVKVLYTAEATVTGGRRGHGRTTDGRLEVDFSSPAALGGDDGPGTNPEQLFALGYAACFQNALLGVARRRQVEIGECTLTARVGIGVIPDNRFGLTVEMDVALPSVEDRALAQELVDAAHDRCPYSNATRGNVDVRLTLV